MSTLVDEDAIVLEALDFPVPCSVSDDHEAHLTVTCRNCGRSWFICNPHQAQVLEEVVRRQIADPTTRVGCFGCGVKEFSYSLVFDVRGL